MHLGMMAALQQQQSAMFTGNTPPPHLELYHPPVREARAETPNFDTNASAQVI